MILRFIQLLFFGLLIQSQTLLLANSENDKLDFHYKIFHKSEKETDFHIKLDLSTYLSKVINDSKYVKIGVSVDITNKANHKNFKSSKEFNLDIKEYEDQIYTDVFTLEINPADYEMTIIVTDLNLNQNIEFNRDFSKNYLCLQENFLFYNEDSSLVYYEENPKSNSIKFHTELIQADSIEVRKYASIQTIAPPPFSSKNSFPDYGNYETIDYFIPSKKTFTLNYLKNKTLFITSDKNSENEGFLLSRYVNHYPKVKTVDLLVNPLRFISSRDEYEGLTNSQNHRRKKFEEFWLDKADGDRDDARYLIKSYYSRVEYANQHFKTYKEGWKTDRGMILIVFGEPDRIDNEGGKEERWIYDSRSGASTISFSFYREDGPFLDNTYTLVRNPMFKTQWYDAVDSWRNGMPYRK